MKEKKKQEKEAGSPKEPERRSGRKPGKKYGDEAGEIGEADVPLPESRPEPESPPRREKQPNIVDVNELSEKERLNLVLAFLQSNALPVVVNGMEIGEAGVLEAVRLLWKTKPVQFAETILPYISFRKKGPPAYLTLLELLRRELEQTPPELRKHGAMVQLHRKLGSPVKPMAPPVPEPEASFEEPEGHFIKNAGLILVWPFFRHLFNALKLVDEKGKFHGEEQQFYAAHLLEYVATRNTITPEYLMPLNKVLCDIPFATPLPAEVELGDEAKELVESMLRAVINQWTALKNTSEDGLRGNFLIRDGKLVKKEKNWNLVVEQKSYDILLDRLPWGINTIKLPWMTPILYVEWR